jgi:hypothetical protein
MLARPQTLQAKYRAFTPYNWGQYPGGLPTVYFSSKLLSASGRSSGSKVNSKSTEQCSTHWLAATI